MPYFFPFGNLRAQAGKVYFRTHLEGEYSQENLDFWNEAGEFAELPEDTPAEVCPHALA